MSDPFRDWLNNMPPSEGDREVEGEERVHAALRDGTCISCRGTRHWLSWLIWPKCEECGAPHCWSCRQRTWEWGLWVMHWTCQHCGHRHDLHNTGG